MLVANTPHRSRLPTAAAAHVLNVTHTHTFDQERVDAALAELHGDVVQVRHVGALVQELEVLLENGAVVLLLDRRELHLNDRLLLGRWPSSNKEAIRYFTCCTRITLAFDHQKS